MVSETICILKPDVTIRGLQFEILNYIVKNGFNVRSIRIDNFSLDVWKRFYSVHKERSFFEELCEFMSGHYVLVCLLSKENCIEDFRALIGNTDPSKALPGTIRKMYGKDICLNAIHGSDSASSFENEKWLLTSKV